MKDREIKISVADSNASTHWESETLIFKEFIFRFKSSRQIEFTLDKFSALPGSIQWKLKDANCRACGELSAQVQP